MADRVRRRQPVEPKPKRKTGDELKAEIDALLNEINAVLESTDQNKTS